MRFFKFIILIGLLNSTSLFAQVEGEASFQIEYKVIFSLDSINLDKKSTEFHRLYSGANVSFYASEGAILTDSLTEDFKNNIFMNNESSSMSEMNENLKDVPASKFSAKVYKDLNENDIWVSELLTTDKYIYRVPDLPLKWEIGEETKIIGSHTSQKAILQYGGRKWIAWFSDDIPVSDGPYIFSGLPGLILEIYDDQNHYQFKIASIKKLKSNHLIKINSKADEMQHVSKAKFIKAFKNYEINPVGSLEAQLGPLKESNMEIPDPTTGENITIQNLLQKVKNIAKSQNNYIELFN